jgi:hypothetical protein
VEVFLDTSQCISARRQVRKLSKEEIEKEQLQPISKLGYKKDVSDFGD